MDTSEILDFIDGKLLLKSNVDFFSPALSLKREEGIHSRGEMAGL